MSPDPDHALSLAFMRNHPAQAARVLETVPTAEAAALFDSAPARLGATVLAAMLPARAAECLTRLDETRALELLAPMGTQAAVAVLRHVPAGQRRRLIAGLPTVIALASTVLLGYTDESLGAWADPDVVVLSGEVSAQQALDRWRDTPRYPVVFLTAADRVFGGSVDVGTLMQAPPATTLASLARMPTHVLAAHAPLSAAPAHPGWVERSLLPVVDPHHHLVGILSRDALTRALRRTASAPVDDNAGAGMPAVLARGYWHAIAGLLEGALVLLPHVPAVASAPDEETTRER